MNTQADSRPDQLEVHPDHPWLRRFPVRTPTLLPATHTNVYVIGQGPLLVVDPASPYPDEQERLSGYIAGLSAAGHRVAGILLTHHHYDHVAGAAVLQRSLKLPLWAHEATAARLPPGLGLQVDRLVIEGQDFPFGPAGLTALHTPGHAPGHICLLDRAGAGVVAGDMVASVGTIVVDPHDDGDMGLYLGSLRRLLGLGAQRLWPAHGTSVADGAALLDFYIRHRLQREALVVAALEAGAGTVAELTPRAYQDVPPALHGLAGRSLLAHLRKLQAEGRATESAEVWRLD